MTHVAEDPHLIADASAIVGLDPDTDAPLSERWRVLGAGMRTRGVLATRPRVAHRFGSDRRVVVKLYKGRGNPKAGEAFVRFHGDAFARLPEAVHTAPVQHSLDAGRWSGDIPYAVLDYIDGTPLAARLTQPDPLPPGSAERVARALLTTIWIPIWSTGLRFKDCHPGNFILTPSFDACAPTRPVLVLIDTDQLRKSALEYLDTPTRWTQRDAHAASGLRRLPGLLHRLALACPSPKRPSASLMRGVRAALASSDLSTHLDALGRPGAAPDAPQRAHAAATALLHTLTRDRIFL